MGGHDMQEPPPYSPLDSDDFCNSMIYRFSNSTEEHHQHLCTVIGAMSQELKDQNLPLTPIAYFGATSSSLDRFLSEPDLPPHVLDSLLAVLSMILPRVSSAILKKKTQYLSDVVVRVLNSKSVTPGATSSAMKCVSHLLIIGEKFSWSDVSPRYKIIVDYVTDDHPKVRRQAHICLRDVLFSFQGTGVLAPASESITNILKRFVLLAGGSSASASEGPKGAQEILYVLDALKDCLPLLSLRFSTSILTYFKSLLELQQPVVSRRITNSLNALCLHPNSEVSPEVLLDLLCSLGLSISANEISADDMTFTAGLLDVGLSKIYALNRKICVVKLPLVFSALGDVLAYEYEEALFAAKEAFKNLINACIDESLIIQGVDQIMTRENVDARKSGPTVIEQSRWNHTNIFSDFGDDETDSDAAYKDTKTISGRLSKGSTMLTSEASSLRSKRSRKAAKSLPEDLFDQLEDEPLDLLDQRKTRSALQSSEHLKRKPGSDDEPQLDPEGRLIIHEEGKKKLKREMSPDPDSDARTKASTQLSANPSRMAQKRRKTSDGGWAYVGSEYGSKKASGDVKRKGKLEPYAYWPLDRKMMSHRPEQRAAARKGMVNVVKLTKKFEGKSGSSALSLKGVKFKKGKKKGSHKKNR